MTTRQILWMLIGTTALLRLAWAVTLGAGNDEAYHYLYTIYPNWSYFDHPPMIALVEAFGLTLLGGLDTTLGLRFGFILLFAGSTWLMARLGERFYGPRAGLLAAFLLNVTAYYGGAVGTFALPDGPLLFFWLLTLNLLATALDHPSRLVLWIAVGLAWGGAMLSKYHAVFLPVGALAYVIITPSARLAMRRPGPYVALAVGLLLFSPVLWWNANHDWASFAFQGGRAMSLPRLRPDALLAALGGQALYLFPWIWLPLVLVLVRRLRHIFEEDTPADRFLLCLAVPPLLAFLMVACFRPILPHWPLVGFLPVFPLLGRSWAEQLTIAPQLMRRRLAVYGALPVAIAALVTVHAHSGLAQIEGNFAPWIRLVPASEDPTLDLHGWDQVAGELQRRGLLDQPGTFLFTRQWYHSGQLALATQNVTPVLCYNPRRAHGFAYWSNADDWLGQDGILVSVEGLTSEATAYEDWFTRIEPLGDMEIVRGGAGVRRISLFRCINQIRPFPFANTEDHPPTRSESLPDLSLTSPVDESGVDSD